MQAGRQAGTGSCVSKKLCPGIRHRQTGRARHVSIPFKLFSCKLKADINADDQRAEHDDSYRSRRSACFVFTVKMSLPTVSRAKAVARSQGPPSFGPSPRHVTANPRRNNVRLGRALSSKLKVLRKVGKALYTHGHCGGWAALAS